MNKYIFCLESNSSNTEKNYFQGIDQNLDIKEQIYKCEKIYYKSVLLQNNTKKCFEKISRALAFKRINFNDKIYFILDGDVESKVELLNNIKIEIKKLVSNITNINSENIYFIIPEKTQIFETFLYLHYNSNNIKNALTIIKRDFPDHKQEKSDYVKKLITKSNNLIDLEKNLKTTNSCYLILLN